MIFDDIAFFFSEGSFSNTQVFHFIFGKIRILLVILISSVALGSSSLVLRAAYAVLPYMGYSQIDRIAVVSCFAISAIAGITFSLASATQKPRVRIAFICIIAAAMVIALGALGMFAVMRESAANAFLDGAARFHESAWEKPGYSRVDEWLDGRGHSWIAFEMKEIGRSALYLVLSGALLLLMSVRRWRTRRLLSVIGPIFALCLLFDITLVARGYYVTQSAEAIAMTEGMRFLNRAPGRPGEWRTARYPAKSRVLLPNTGQMFHIPCLEGRSTIAPDAHLDFREVVSEYRGAPVGSGGRGFELAVDTYNLTCSRYVLSSRGEPPVLSRDFELVHETDMRIFRNLAVLEKGICLRRSAVGEREQAGVRYWRFTAC